MREEFMKRREQICTFKNEGGPDPDEEVNPLLCAIFVATLQVPPTTSSHKIKPNIYQPIKTKIVLTRLN